MLHPTVLTVVALDLVATVLVGTATITAVRVLLHWRAGAADRGQLRLERAREAASLQGRLAALLFLCGSLTTGVAIAGVLPDLVPGAMCGTGVIEAMGGRGNRALLLRLGALAALLAWHLFDRLDRSSPRAPLAEPAARAMLLAAAIVPVAVWSSIEALARLDTQTPIDCCAAVYDEIIAGGAQTGLLAGIDDSSWLVAFGICTVISLPAALWVAAGRAPAWSHALLGLTAPLSAMVGGAALVRVFAAYHYEVLQHHCPWCLFLAEHGRVGYPLLGALALVLVEGPTAWIATAIGTRHPELRPAARRRARRAGLAVVVGSVAFFALAVGPAIAWRLRHGVWMG